MSNSYDQHALDVLTSRLVYMHAVFESSIPRGSICDRGPPGNLREERSRTGGLIARKPIGKGLCKALEGWKEHWSYRLQVAGFRIDDRIRSLVYLPPIHIGTRFNKRPKVCSD